MKVETRNQNASSDDVREPLLRQAQDTDAESNERPRSPWIALGDLEHVAALVLATGLNLLPAVMRARVIHQLSRIVGTIWYKTNRGTVSRVRHHLQGL